MPDMKRAGRVNLLTKNNLLQVPMLLFQGQVPANICSILFIAVKCFLWPLFGFFFLKNSRSRTFCLLFGILNWIIVRFYECIRTIQDISAAAKGIQMVKKVHMPCRSVTDFWFVYLPSKLGRLVFYKWEEIFGAWCLRCWKNMQADWDI